MVSQSQRERYLRLRRESIKAGICPVCRLRKPTEFKVTCKSCQDVAKKHRLKNPKIKQYKKNKLIKD